MGSLTVTSCNRKAAKISESLSIVADWHTTVTGNKGESTGEGGSVEH